MAITRADWSAVERLADSVLRLDPSNVDGLSYLNAAHERAASGHGTDTGTAERRRMTVMFCDLVDFTPLSEQLDPEDIRDFLNAYHSTCESIVREFDGQIAQYTGDGLFAYFGYPQAHEDDPVRAVAAGLEIVEAVPSLVDGIPVSSPLRCRMGIHHGLVVIGEMGGSRQVDRVDIVGMTVNIAARLQSVSAPGSVTVSGDVAQLLAGRVELEAVGARRLKGVSEPVDIWRAVAVRSGAPSRRPGRLDSPMIGRQPELDTLLRCWETACSGKGSAVVIHGAAGIGKSRLVRALQEEIEASRHATVEVRCEALRQTTALYPFTDHLASDVFRVRAGGSHADQLARTEEAPDRGNSGDAEAGSRRAAYLGLTAPSETRSITGRDQFKERTFDTLTSWLAEVAAAGPLLVVVEDCQWIDPSSVEFLNFAWPRLANRPLMLLLTARSDENLKLRPQPTQLHLDRLSQAEIGHIVDGLLATADLIADVRDRVVGRSEGIPLFAEELSRAVLAAQASSQARLAVSDVPATLHDSLMAQLDRAGAARRVALTGAAVGGPFPLRLLASVLGDDEVAIQGDVTSLLDAGILTSVTGKGERRYTFRHVLLQEVAYDSILRRDRTRLHRKIATVMEQNFRELSEEQPEVVAYHLTRGDEPQRAVEYLTRAASRAIERFANTEAKHLLQQAQELLEKLPPTDFRRERELAISLQLAQVHSEPSVHTWVRVHQRKRP